MVKQYSSTKVTSQEPRYLFWVFPGDLIVRVHIYPGRELGYNQTAPIYKKKKEVGIETYFIVQHYFCSINVTDHINLLFIDIDALNFADILW